MFDIQAVQKLYAAQAERHAIGRRRLGHALTLGEKILFAHLDDPEGQEFERKASFIPFVFDEDEVFSEDEEVDDLG